MIDLYQKFISGGLRLIFGSGCRYFPACSDYAQEAIEKHGIAKGGLIGLKRFLSCHPFGKSGYDPVI